MFLLSEKIDLSRLRHGCAQRMLRPIILDKKRQLLRHFQERYVTCTLPRRYSETKVEQSFNEQLFAEVLNYRTLLSGGELPFHILPKNYFGGNYDDFSIGFFGLKKDSVLASAELKSPGADLDAPQLGSQYQGQTPVEQALNTATSMSTCRWVIVSNMRELRLYRTSDRSMLVKVDLFTVWSREEVASLCALFDRCALLGREQGTESEMETYLEASHLAQPLPVKSGCCRLVFRFTPTFDDPLSLYDVETCLRAIIDHLGSSGSGHGVVVAGWIPIIRVDSGWTCCDEGAASGIGWKLCMSRYGEVLYSVYLPIANDGSILWATILAVAKSFWTVLLHVNMPSIRHAAASIGAELRDCAKTKLIVPKDAVIPPGLCEGISQSKNVVVGEFNCTLQDVQRAQAALVFCLCDLAIQFRDARGGILLSVGSLRREL